MVGVRASELRVLRMPEVEAWTVGLAPELS